MNENIKIVLRPIFRALSNQGIINPHTPYEIDLMLAGVKPVAILPIQAINSEIKNAIENGVLIEFKSIQLENRAICILSQPDKVEDAEEVYDRMYNEGKNSYPISNEQKAYARIGILLGYTDRDINLDMKHTKFIPQRVLNLIMDIRAYARKEVMLSQNPKID